MRAITERVFDVPHEAVAFFAFYLQVAHGGLQHWVPVHQALAPVDQALLVQAHEGFGHGLGQLGVHREVFAAPVHTGTHAAHLAGDDAAAFLFPFPHLGDEIFTRLGRSRPHVVAADFLRFQLALHHDLRRDAGVIHAGNPRGVVAHHAVVARQAVHDGLVERVAHVQCARHIGGWQLNREGGLARLGLTCSPMPRHGVTPALPLWPPMCLDGVRLEGLGEAVKAGLAGWEQCVGHGDSKKGEQKQNGTQQDTVLLQKEWRC